MRTIALVAVCCGLALAATGGAAPSTSRPPVTNLKVSPDSRFVYEQHVEYNSDGSIASDVLQVYARDDRGLTEVQCLAGVNAVSAPHDCDHVLPPGLETMRMTAGGTAIYLAGHRTQVGRLGILARLARDPETGRLTVSDCLAGEAHDDQPGCRTNALLKGLPRLLVVDQDLYAYIAGKLISFRPDPATGKLEQVHVIPPPGLGKLTASPDGLRVYAPGSGGSLIMLYRDPQTGAVD